MQKLVENENKSGIVFIQSLVCFWKRRKRITNLSKADYESEDEAISSISAFALSEMKVICQTRKREGRKE
jgi:hypothetical protein